MSPAQSVADQQIEYSVYVYHPQKKPGGKNTWEKLEVTTDMNKALSMADELVETRKYPKVEVKKKFFDAKNNRTVDISLKVLEGDMKKEMSVVMIIVLALLCSGVAFGAVALTHHFMYGGAS